MDFDGEKMSQSWNKLTKMITQIRQFISQRNPNLDRNRQPWLYINSKQKTSYDTSKHHLAKHLKQLFQELADDEQRKQRQASRQLNLYHDSLTQYDEQDTNTSSVNFNESHLDRVYYLLQKKDMKNLICYWKQMELVIDKFALIIKEFCQIDLLVLEEKEADFKPILDILNSTSDIDVLRESIKNQINKRIVYQIKLSEAKAHLRHQVNRCIGLQHLLSFQIQKTKKLLQTLEKSLNNSQIVRANLFQNLNTSLSFNKQMSQDISQMIRKEFTNKCSDDPFLLSCEEQGVESKHAQFSQIKDKRNIKYL